MILLIENLSKSYKRQKVLDDIKLMIDSPGIWALVGPNGVGKTTLLNVITNIIPADSGKIELIGKSNKNYKVFKDVSYQQDNSILFEYLTGYDHLKYVCDIHRIPRKQIKEVANYVGMESYIQKTVGNYSLGMKQHLLLAMAIVNKPKLLLLDEPLNGLDPTSSILMRKILLELAQQGTTVILSSHNLAEIDRVTKQILFLKNGQLIEVNMKQHEKVTYIFSVSDPIKAVNILNQKGFNVEQSTNNDIRIELIDQSLEQLIDIIREDSINILDIHRTVSGSEKIYEKLFTV